MERVEFEPNVVCQCADCKGKAEALRARLAPEIAPKDRPDISEFFDSAGTYLPPDQRRPLGVKARKLARFDLMPFDALWEVAEVLGWGATNRGDSERNWEKGLVAGDLVAAAFRHLSQWASGEELDEETGRSHLAHATCLLLFLRALQLRGNLVDDRPPGFGPLRSEKVGEAQAG